MDVKKKWIEPELTTLDIEETLSGPIQFNVEGAFITQPQGSSNPDGFTRS